MKRENDIVEQVIAELSSEFCVATTGPLKEINRVDLESVTCNPARNEIGGRIAVQSYCQGLHDDSWNGSKTFDVTLDDLRRLSREAPQLRRVFATFAQELSSRLEQERAAYIEDVEAWCDKGLPAKRAVKPLKRFHLKNPPC